MLLHCGEKKVAGPTADRSSTELLKMQQACLQLVYKKSSREHSATAQPLVLYGLSITIKIQGLLLLWNLKDASYDMETHPLSRIKTGIACFFYRNHSTFIFHITRETVEMLKISCLYLI